MQKTNLKKYSWNLETILNGSALEKLYANWLSKQAEIISLFPKFSDNLINFKKWLSLNEQYDILSNRLNNYVSNNYNENQNSPEWIAWTQKINNDANKFHVSLSNYTNKVIENKANLLKYLKDQNIKEFKREFELIFRQAPHILKEDQQKVLSTTSIINGGFSTIFSTLCDTEIKFEDALNSSGKKIPLKTIADVTKNLKSDDRQIRKTTWINFNQSYSKYENTLTQTLYYNYLMLNTLSKIHKFPDYVGATAFTDEIDVSVIEDLYKHVEIFKSSFQKYRTIFNQILKKQLNLKSLEPWDKTMDLSKKTFTFSIEDTQKIVLNSLKPLGDEYLTIVKKAFNDQWISWLPKPNKQQGAYSIGETKGLSKYYISLNFDNTIRSVYTIAHELGHSLNSYFINKKQKIYYEVSIFYAEISSIVNEMLLSYYLLDIYRNDKNMKQLVLNELINNFFATVSRQIVFSHTEYVLNQDVNQSKPFTKENVKKTYLEMIERYQGFDKDMVNKINKEPYIYSLSTILRIPHFYIGNFYVYKYAIGQIVSVLVANKIYSGDKNTLDKYFKFLSSGCSLSPIETIKILGIDLKNKNIYIGVQKIVDSWINQLNSLDK